MADMKRWGRRYFLRGLAGATLGLPVLEGLSPRISGAKDPDADPFLIIFRKASGVQQKFGGEPERFWPHEFGPLTPENVEGRAVAELSDHLDNLLMVKNINQYAWGFGDGHANGCLQSLTNRGPLVGGKAGNSEASGESLDSKIARDLNPPGNDSMFLFAGDPDGFIGGACLSHRGPGDRRAAIADPVLAYHVMTGVGASTDVLRQQSINDLVRPQMQALMSSPKLSGNDVKRLDLHFQSIRDLEGSLVCEQQPTDLALLEELGPGYHSKDGDELLAAVRAHCHVAALAVACGYTRVVVIQFGSGNNARVNYRHPDTNELMEDYHFISHRKNSHDVTMGDPIPGSDLVHHFHDRVHFGPYKYLLDKLTSIETVNGNLLDSGVTAFYSDVGTGPDHGYLNLPWILAGSAGGFFKQGEFLEVEGGQEEPPLTNAKLVNTLGSAIGLRNEAGDYLDDFGDTTVIPKGLLPEIMA